jgi:hypothetical protein
MIILTFKNYILTLALVVIFSDTVNGHQGKSCVKLSFVKSAWNIFYSWSEQFCRALGSREPCLKKHWEFISGAFNNGICFHNDEGHLKDEIHFKQKI